MSLFRFRKYSRTPQRHLSEIIWQLINWNNLRLRMNLKMLIWPKNADLEYAQKNIFLSYFKLTDLRLASSLHAIWTGGPHNTYFNYGQILHQLFVKIHIPKTYVDIACFRLTIGPGVKLWTSELRAALHPRPRRWRQSHHVQWLIVAWEQLQISREI